MKHKIWMRLFMHTAVIITVFACALAIANGALLTKFFIWREKSILASSADTIESINLLDTDSASAKLQSIENSDNLQIDIYSGNVVIYSTLRRSAREHPGMSGFDFLFGVRSPMQVLDRQSDGKNGVYETAVDQTSRLKYIIYRREYGENMLEITVQQNLLEQSAQVASQFMLIISGICLVGAMIWSIFFARKFSKPISEMNEIAVDMSKLDFSRKLTPDSKDEIGQLAGSINELSDSLDKALRELNAKNESLQTEIDLERKLDSMRKGFVANVSHELKTPIAIIQGYAEGLAEDIGQSAEKRMKYCEIIKEESERMNRLVMNLLELSRFESGFVLHSGNFDLCGLIVHLMDKNTAGFAAKNITPTLMLPDRLQVSADELCIEQALQNYISNALSHVNDDGEIKISCEVKGENVRVYVFNSGSTVASEDMENIWQSFYRADKSHNRSAGRYGLGLSIVKAIMQAHGKPFGVYNYDGGVCFWLEIGLAER